MKSSAKRVQDFLDNNGFQCEVKILPDTTRTAQEAANAIGCTVPQIAKSLIFKDSVSGDPVLLIASGSNRVDVKKVEGEVGLKLVKADGKFVKERVGYAIGGVPPVGHNEKLKTFIDPDLKQYDVIWAAAGTPFAVFSMQTAELQKMTEGTFLELAEDI